VGKGVGVGDGKGCKGKGGTIYIINSEILLK